MFEVGEYIVYGTKGVCQVEDITTMQMGDMPKSQYYVLQPVGQKGSKIYVATGNQKTIMRKILTASEAKELVQEIPQIEELWLDNEKVREEKYKECIRTCECRDLVKIIKTLYLRKEKRIREGKKITATDERYLKIAEDNLYSELSIPLGVAKADMPAYITAHIED
ncbi:MAG: CarD family transcriptional regulator [Lachnospiraceae bacterium]|nr:CarD family transcriptional regulator [Lachnospiraceae bacterium]